MTLKDKSGRVILFFAAAVILLLLLAMSLGRLTLSEGYTIPLNENDALSNSAGVFTEGGEIWLVIIRGMLAIAILLLPIYIVHSLTSPQGRKRLVADLIIIVMLMVLASILENQEEPEEFIPPAEEQQSMGDPMDFAIETFAGEPMPDLPDQAPTWVTGVVIAIMAVVLVALVLGVLWYLNKRKARVPSALDQLADEAQRAIDDIQGGGDLQTAILRSYAEMTRLVRDELGIARDRAMTARDFEDFLERKGLPGAPLRTLTQLFEQARYGSTPPGEGEETQALRCLTDIVDGIRALKVTEA